MGNHPNFVHYQIGHSTTEVMLVSPVLTSVQAVLMSLEASMRDMTLIWVPVTIVDIH